MNVCVLDQRTTICVLNVLSQLHLPFFHSSEQFKFNWFGPLEEHLNKYRRKLLYNNGAIWLSN